MSLNVLIDETGVMSFQPAIERGNIDWSAVPMGKAIVEAIQQQYHLPPDITDKVHSYVYYNETTKGRCTYGVCSICCCCCILSNIDGEMWNNDRDVDVVRQEVMKLFNSLGCGVDEYKIIEFGGSTKGFTGGKTVLKVHFNDPNVHEL